MKTELPDIPVFRNLLSSLRLTEPEKSDDYNKSLAIRPSIAEDKGKKIFYNEIYLYHKKVESTDLNSLIRKIQSILSIAGHPYDEPVVKAILCAYCLHPAKANDPIGSLNEILSHISMADLSQYYIFPFSPPDGYELNLGSFKFGLLDAEQLAYRCLKVKSDYFERYGEQLRGEFAIQRNVSKVKVIVWHSLAEKFGIFTTQDTLTKDAGYHLILNYFEKISESYFNSFWSDIREEQLLVTAAGGAFIDERVFEQIIGAQKLSIFMNMGNLNFGYVVPLKTGFFTIDFARTDRKIPEMLKMLKEKFAFDQFRDYEIHRTLKMYAIFVSKARRDIQDGRFDEAFLNFVISLDLLLGDKRTTTDSIASRVAIITHGYFKQSFQEQRKLIQRIYDNRSQYVHGGLSVDQSLLNTVEEISKQVLFTLLRLNQKENSQSPNFLEIWFKKLDFLISAVQAGEEISKEKFENAGIEM